MSQARHGVSDAIVAMRCELRVLCVELDGVDDVDVTVLWAQHHLAHIAVLQLSPLTAAAARSRTLAALEVLGSEGEHACPHDEPCGQREVTAGDGGWLRFAR